MTIRPQTVYWHFRQARCPRRFVVSVGEHLGSDGRPIYDGPTVKYYPIDRKGRFSKLSSSPDGTHICRLQAFEAWAKNAEIDEASTDVVRRNPGALRGIIAEPTADSAKGEAPS